MHYSFVFEGLMHFAACVDHPQIGFFGYLRNFAFTSGFNRSQNRQIPPAYSLVVMRVHYYLEVSYQIRDITDGIVPVSSVEEAEEYQSLGRTDNCHTNTFTDEEFDKVMEVLLN